MHSQKTVGVNVVNNSGNKPSVLHVLYLRSEHVTDPVKQLLANDANTAWSDAHLA